MILNSIVNQGHKQNGVSHKYSALYGKTDHSHHSHLHSQLFTKHISAYSILALLHTVKQQTRITQPTGRTGFGPDLVSLCL